MILELSYYNITDNSGAKILKGIKAYKSTPQKTLKLGKNIYGVLKHIKTEQNTKLKLKAKEKKNSILVRTKNPIKRLDGSQTIFFDNSVVLIDKKHNPLASRILGAIPYDLKSIKFTGKLLLASEYITL